jgi:hypothetical protein
MKNKKPLQFVKELPPHAELWKIIDETIIHPAEGLSVEQLKHYMYLYLCMSDGFKTAKNRLQTEMSTEDVLTIKSLTINKRDLPYPEILPEVEGLPLELVLFLYEHRISTAVLPDEACYKLTCIHEVLDNPIPDLSSLPHSNEVVGVHSERDLELAIYTALIDKTPIPTFRLVVESTSDDSDGWVEWHGRDCPVDPGVRVETKGRDGNSLGSRLAEGWSWKHLGNTSDIIAYRIIEEDTCEA